MTDLPTRVERTSDSMIVVTKDETNFNTTTWWVLVVHYAADGGPEILEHTNTLRTPGTQRVDEAFETLLDFLINDGETYAYHQGHRGAMEEFDPEYTTSAACAAWAYQNSDWLESMRNYDDA